MFEGCPCVEGVGEGEGAEAGEDEGDGAGEREGAGEDGVEVR